jgi:hypothetical protein
MMRRTLAIIALALLAAGCDGSVPGTATAPDAASPADGPGPDGAAAGLSAGLDEIDFGCVGLDKPVAFRVEIENRAASTVGPLQAHLQAPEVAGVMLSILADGCSDEVLGPREACGVSIFYLSQGPSKIEATLQVTAPGAPALVLPLRAQASSVGDRMLPEPAPIDFGTVKAGSVSPPRTLELHNLGDTPATPSAATLLKGEVFRILLDTCAGITLPPLGICKVSVRFAPRVAGQYTDRLRLGPGEACDPFPSIDLIGTAN